MPLDKSHVGRSYPPTAPYKVAREKIREFADAIGATDPLHRDPAFAAAKGYPDVIAPPTFPVVLTMTAGAQFVHDPEVGIDFSRVVHGDQRFRYTRPVHAGDKLTCVLVVEDLTARAGHDFVTLRTDVSTVDGDPVVSVWARLVVRGED
jgi:acyl dehydratase